MDSGRNEENIIAVKNLVVSYGDFRVLKGVNLEIPRGMTTVIIGGSGCGKSTLLRHVIGLQKPGSGEILIRGMDITAMKESELAELLRKVGVVFQSSALFNSLTVGDNIALPLREHTHLEESTIQIMTKIKLDLVGLSGFDDYMPS
ncbi:MAG: ATP-binding cassette domain-containing protein, partial [Gemmatimonadota bacterium]|nr:ATP-binding cassette domain-containing protein [Gemmatimonadota bacterium]